MAVQEPARKGRSRESADKFLTFALNAETYGIEILKVKEIIGTMAVTEVPEAPGYVRGVINLRGKIIPVVDLRHRLGFTPIETTERTCIIVVDLAEQGGAHVQAGILVDAVSEVTQIPPGDIEPPPALGEDFLKGGIQGMAKIKEKVVILLNIGNVLGKMAEGFQAA